MADLRKEYTDLRGRTHKVEHFLVPAEDQAVRDQIVEELLHALTGVDRRRSD